VGPQATTIQPQPSFRTWIRPQPPDSHAAAVAVHGSASSPDPAHRHRAMDRHPTRATEPEKCTPFLAATAAARRVGDSFLLDLLWPLEQQQCLL
jgi:hypothetical protein